MKLNKINGSHKLIWLITLVPLMIAWAMAYSGIGLSGATKNNGILMPTGLQVPTDLTEIQKGKWGLLVISEQCEFVCQQQIYRLQQLHKSMGKHQGRIQAIWLSTQSPSDIRNLSVEIDFLNVKRLNNQTLLSWFNRQQLAWQDQSVWLIDPKGILVMQFKPELSGRQIMADLKWLLKASRIG